MFLAGLERGKRAAGVAAMQAARHPLPWPAALWLLGISAIGPGCRSSTPPSPGLPPVILISADTLRADRLNCYGYAARQLTPHMDALAEDAVLFESHIAASPWTTPSHLSLFTSLHPSRHGVVATFRELTLRKGEEGFSRLPDATLTLAEVLAGGGFATGAFTGGSTLDPRLGFGQGFEVYRTDQFKLGEASFQRMLSWVRRQAGRPFFLFWHTFEVHAPYLPTTYLADVRPPAAVQKLRREIERARGPEGWPSQSAMLNILRREALLKAEVTEALYAGGVRSFDAWLGRFIAFLRAEALYEPALILLTSDHGEEFGERSPERVYDSHGETLFEELVRVPLLVKLPGQAQRGTRVKQVTAAIDVMPTVLELVGLTQAAPQLEGSSLVRLWSSGAAAGSRAAVMEALISREERKGLRDDRYKLVLSSDAETVAREGRHNLPASPAERALFDLLSDPGERVDLLAGAPSTEHARLAATLEAQLRERLAGPKGRPQRMPLQPDLLERLRALGYAH